MTARTSMDRSPGDRLAEVIWAWALSARIRPQKRVFPEGFPRDEKRAVERCHGADRAGPGDRCAEGAPAVFAHL